MLASEAVAGALGLDFGTTNTVAALADGSGGTNLIEFEGEQATGAIFRPELQYLSDSQAWRRAAFCWSRFEAPSVSPLPLAPVGRHNARK